MAIHPQYESDTGLAVGSTFRGEIWEWESKVPMGRGYSNNDEPFDIETACYLKPVFRAIKDPTIRQTWLKKAVQCLGTFVVEKSNAFFAVNEPGDMTLYDQDEASALDHAKSRLMPYLHSIPSLAERIKEASSRHNVGMTEFYLPGMTLRVWPLNIASTQRVTLRYVTIHDAFQSERTGLIANAIARTTQHPHDRKIMVESQGSDEGDDFDLGFNSTDQRALHVICPICNTGQPFEFHRKRPADFVPVDGFGWETPKPGTHAGFNRGPDSLILLPGGGYNEQAILQETFYECFHCGGRWRDIPSTRKALDASSYYVAQNPNANPENVGFNWPCWINQRVRWGGEYVMMGYLNAKKAMDADNPVPMKIWMQKRAARTWSDRLQQQPVPLAFSIFTPGQSAENADHDGLIVDCQKHKTLDTVGTFWWETYRAMKNGDSPQMDRGFAESWEEWFEVQRKWKILNYFVTVDGRKWTPEILKQAAANHKWVKGTRWGKEIEYPSTWTILLGDSARHFQWPDKVWRVWSPPTRRMEDIQDAEGKLVKIPVFLTRWSNLSIADQLNDLLIGGEGKPKFTFLPREQLSPEMQSKEVGDLTWDKQLTAEYRTEKNGKVTWEKLPNRANHGGDLARMRLVRMAMRGLAGHQMAPEK